MIEFYDSSFYSTKMGFVPLASPDARDSREKAEVEEEAEAEEEEEEVARGELNGST